MLTCAGPANIGRNQDAPGLRRSIARGRSSRSRGPPLEASTVYGRANPLLGTILIQ
jgi:hypothetical protein